MTAVSNIYDIVATIPRPSNATAYTALDVVGIADATTPANAGSAVLDLSPPGGANKALYVESLRLSTDQATVPAGMTTLRLHLYDTIPTAILDNAPFVRSPADAANYLGYVDTGTMVADGGSVVNVASSVNLRIALKSTGKLYGILQTIGAFTPTSGAVKTITLRMLQA